MARFYTGFGDKGKTAIGSKVVDKSDMLIGAIGELDELNAELGVTIENVKDEKITETILEIQDRLFVAGAQLASLMDDKFTPKMVIGQADTESLERHTYELGNVVGELKQFVLPGGPNGSAYLDKARAVARRTERTVVGISKDYTLDTQILVYLNRLSSFLFVAARYLNKTNNVEERNPKY